MDIEYLLLFLLYMLVWFVGYRQGRKNKEEELDNAWSEGYIQCLRDTEEELENAWTESHTHCLKDTEEKKKDETS